NDRVDFASEEGIGLIRDLTERLESQKDSLTIADVRSVAKPLGTTEAAQEVLGKLPLPRSLVEGVVRKRAVAYYVSHTGELKGHVTRMDVVLAAHPFSSSGIEHLRQLEDSLKANLPEVLMQGSQLYFS